MCVESLQYQTFSLSHVEYFFEVYERFGSILHNLFIEIITVSESNVTSCDFWVKVALKSS